MIFVDSNVLIDLIEAHAQWAQWSETQLTRAAQQGALVVNAIVYAEIARTFPDAAAIDSFLTDAGIRVLPIPTTAAFAASCAHRIYRAAGGARTATLPDFFIAAHAQVENHTLLTRDATHMRTYFPQLRLICPATHP